VKGPVICGIDDSTIAAGAVHVARELAQRYELPLVYAHVMESGGDDNHAERLLLDAAASETAELASEDGHPADRLVALARARNASFLVVGNHGPRSSLLGSISADVSRRASCPVVVVPPTAEPTEQEPAASSQVEGGIVRFNLGHSPGRVT
jgi:nucleotide-binding universal stress UspA family protein